MDLPPTFGLTRGINSPPWKTLSICTTFMNASRSLGTKRFIPSGGLNHSSNFWNGSPMINGTSTNNKRSQKLYGIIFNSAPFASDMAQTSFVGVTKPEVCLASKNPTTSE